MFKRAVITDEISQDLSRAIAVARRFGLEGVELRSVWEKNPHEWSSAEIRSIKEQVQKAELEVPCLAAPIFKCNLSPVSEYQAHLTILKQTIEVAHELGSVLIRGFTFWDSGDFESDLPEILQRIGAIEEFLKNNGIVMVLESDPATAANTSEKLEIVISQLASNNIKALWDPGNNLYVNDAETPFPQGYERLRPHLGHIHIKDIRRDLVTGEVEACPLGKGEVGFGAVFTRLKADNYSGWLSLETHYRLRGPLSENLLALPKGSAFSLGGEEATVESLENWREMMESLR